MKVNVDLNFTYISKTIINSLPLKYIENIMKSVGWVYASSKGKTPSVDDIKGAVLNLLNHLKDKSSYTIGSGGFDISRINEDEFRVYFTISSFCWTEKHQEWCGEDLEYFNIFKSRIFLTIKLLNKYLDEENLENNMLEMLVTDNELSSFLKKKIEFFTNSNLDEFYDRKFHLYFYREYCSDDNDILYHVDFVGLDKKFKI